MKSTATTITALLLAVLSVSDGFSTSFVLKTPATTLRMAAGKGFGESPAPKKKAPPVPVPVATPEDTLAEDEYNPFDKSQFVAPDTSKGKAALDRMRREKAEERNAQLQKMNELQEVDQMMRDTGGEAAVIPEKVAQRMGKRMLPFVGIPLFGSMGAFVFFWYQATYNDMEFQPVLVAGTTIALLAIGLVGITYSMMSASWDPEREGSVLGTDEFARNVDNIKGGLSRSRENAQVREQIMMEENRARMEAPKASKPKKQAAASLAEKMGDEFD